MIACCYGRILDGQAQFKADRQRIILPCFLTFRDIRLKGAVHFHSQGFCHSQPQAGAALAAGGI